MQNTQTTTASSDPTTSVRARAESVVETAKETLTQATQGGARLLHDGRDAALDTYHSARDYALDTAHDVSDRARRSGDRIVRYARRASETTGRFVSVHALPLTVVGAGLGWLAWSIRRDAQRHGELPRHANMTTCGNRLIGVRTSRVYEE
ncbi:MAG: hypothetical protein RLZZ450_1840 [Pseudomonadota bacterium]|jgi:ElaB/YqjD/DUF883 family membrane-anchored ribosome-binding protein